MKEQEDLALKKKEKKGVGGVRVDEKKLEECQHHWFNLGRTRGKGRDPIKITLGWSESRLTRATSRAQSGLGKV